MSFLGNPYLNSTTLLFDTELINHIAGGGLSFWAYFPLHLETLYLRYLPNYNMV